MTVGTFLNLLTLVRELALSSGFYLLEQQGDNVRITAPENRRVW
jgi:hypothetical protein